MQPNRPTDGTDVLLSDPLLVAARDAWFRGDFVACLDSLADGTISTDAGRREAVLLRCRALLRLRRAAELIPLIAPRLPTFVAIDEACTARMLHATAIARAGDVDRGIGLLEDVATSARTLGAHRAVRAEIQYEIAYAHWLRRDYDAVLKHAVSAEEARADVISVRAASLRGFVALAKERYYNALKLFRWAYETYRSCKEKDADLLEQIVVQIAFLEVALQSAEIKGTHTIPPEIEARLSGAREPGVTRMQIVSMDSWLYAFDGDRENAYERARVADHLATSPAWLVWSLANRAQIAVAFGDVACARTFSSDAVELAGTVDWNATTDEERVGLLLLAEALAITDARSAVTILERYDTLTSAMDRSRLFHDDVRLWILETFVRGLVYRIQGDVERARDAFIDVHTVAQRVGVLWRSALALIELDETPCNGRRQIERPLQLGANIVRENFPASFLARRIGRWSQVLIDPVAVRLAPQPREVLKHLLTGKNPKEIAVAMKLSEDTVKGYTKTLFRAFAVNSTPQLLVACYERGIGSPAWWSVLDDRDPLPVKRSETVAQPARSGHTRHRSA